MTSPTRVLAARIALRTQLAQQAERQQAERAQLRPLTPSLSHSAN